MRIKILILFFILFNIGILEASEKFAGEIPVKIYHTLLCPKVSATNGDKITLINENDMIYFTSIKGIKQIGYTSCPICNPREEDN
jgi:hypothetical protein